MSMQHYRAFACQLHAVVPAAGVAEAQRFEDSTCSAHRGGRICHVRASGPDVSTAMVANALLPILTAGDVVVVNEGLWHRALAHTNTSRELSNARAAVLPMREMLRIGVLAFWRETTAQHFNTRTGQYKPTGCTGHNCSASCKEVHDPSWATDLNAQVTGVMRAGGIEVLPAFHESLEMWTDHVGRRRVARGAGAHSHAQLDCTHLLRASEALHSDDPADSAAVQCAMVKSYNYHRRAPARRAHPCRVWLTGDTWSRGRRIAERSQVCGRAPSLRALLCSLRIAEKAKREREVR